MESLNNFFFLDNNFFNLKFNSSEKTLVLILDFFINAGIYVLNPIAVDRIKKNIYRDMPDLLTELTNEGLPVSAFPVHEYWLDMGGIKEYDRAIAEYSAIFE